MRFDTEVTEIDFDITPERKRATRIHWVSGGAEGSADLGPDDLVFTTIGSLVQNSDEGDHHTAAKLNEGPAPARELWRRIAAKDPAFGRPDVFGAHIPETKWESATEAAYRLLGIERGVPEVFNSTYDIRSLLNAVSHMRDGGALNIPGPDIVRRKLIGRLESSEVGQLLAEYGLIADE